MKSTSLLATALSLFLLAPHSRAAEPETLDAYSENWNLHVQATAIPQFHPAFSSPYSGPNSLSPDSELNTSFTGTIYLGTRTWKNGEAYLDPEISAGNGFSSTHGLAAFPNGEIYRVDTPAPRAYIARFFLRQFIGLGGGEERLESDKNQLGAAHDANRLVFTAGKFSLNDYFDNNAYAHDPRTQFLSWALMDNGAWDYAADTRGYTWAVMGDLKLESWSVRAAAAMMPVSANSIDLDTQLGQAHGLNFEVEHRHSLGEHPGVARAQAFVNQARMGSYAQSLALSPNSPDIAATRDYRTKYGFGLNLEQELLGELGVFARLGWDDGATESFVFTEVDRTISAGAAWKGQRWSRPQDTLGAALIWNGLSAEHASYLAAGGTGFMLGDGALNYAPEELLEVYYSAELLPRILTVSADLQQIFHPGYNQDRGPVTVAAIRGHFEF